MEQSESAPVLYSSKPEAPLRVRFFSVLKGLDSGGQSERGDGAEGGKAQSSL